MASEAQKRAARKYLAKKRSVTIRLDPTVADLLEKRAKSNGESLNALVNRAIVMELKRNVRSKAPEVHTVGTPTDSLRADFLAKLNAAQPTVQAPSPVPKVQPAQPKTEIEQVDWHELCMKAREAQEEKRKEDII